MTGLLLASSGLPPAAVERLREAGFPATTPALGALRRAAVDWLERRAPPWLVVVGGTGTTKTTLAQWITLLIIERGEVARYVSAPALLARWAAAAARSAADAQDVLDSVMVAPWLALDELDDGCWRTEARADALMQLLDARYAAWSPTLIASNLAPVDWPERLASRAADRGRARVVVLADVEDLRRGGHAR